jgi:hydroxymethylglutaryl-CoA synthase
MPGVISYGVHIPRWRMGVDCINQAWGRAGGSGEKSVANYDEDCITMGVASGSSCMQHSVKPASEISGLYFATTSPPYREKSSASVIAAALDLTAEIRTADYSASLKASVDGLLSAIDAVSARRAENIMLIASDCRVAEPGSPLETSVGDASASLLIGKEGVVAEVTETYSFCNEIMDVWRREEDRYLIQDDVRFAQIYGFQKSVTEAVNGILRETSLTPADFAKIAITPVDSRSHIGVASKLGFEKSQIVSPLNIGLCGTAQPLLLLALALEKSKPKDKILLISYGDGAHAIIFEVTENINKVKTNSKICEELNTRRQMTNYTKYLAFNNMLKGQEPLTQPFSSTSLAYREKNCNVRFYAKKCQACGKSTFLRDIHVCPNCYAQDKYAPVKLSKNGTLFTYNKEFYYPSPDPPTIMAVVDFPEGVRITTQMTDTDPDQVKANMPVEMCFRKFHDGNMFHNYFWKCRPKPH